MLITTITDRLKIYIRVLCQCCWYASQERRSRQKKPQCKTKIGSVLSYKKIKSGSQRLNTDSGHEYSTLRRRCVKEKREQA